MPEQWMAVFSETVLCILAAEGLLLCIFQLRTNILLKKAAKLHIRKKEHLRKLQEDVRSGSSDIPVVRFEHKKQPAAGQEKRDAQENEKKHDYDAKEMAVLQEMMTEFFG